MINLPLVALTSLCAFAIDFAYLFAFNAQAQSGMAIYDAIGDGLAIGLAVALCHRIIVSYGAVHRLPGSALLPRHLLVDSVFTGIVITGFAVAFDDFADKFGRLDDSISAKLIAASLVALVAGLATAWVHAVRWSGRSEAKYSELLDCHQDIIVESLPDGQITYVSPSCKGLGYAVSDFLGRPAASFIHLEDLPGFQVRTAEMFSSGKIAKQEDRMFRIRTKSGHYCWMENSPSVRRDWTGKPVAIISVLRDVTERKLAQAKLDQSQSLLSRMSETARIGAWEYDCQSGLVSCSPHLLQILNSGSSIDSAEAFASHFSAASRTRLKRALAEGQDGKRFVLELAVNDAQRPQVWVRVIGERLVGEGKPDRLVGSLQDISDELSLKHRSELAQRDARLASSQLASYQSALDEQLIVSIADANGVLIHVNDRFCKTSGYERNELIGKTHAVLGSGHHSRSYFASMWRVISTGRSWRAEMCNKAKNGKLFWVDTTIIPILDGNGLPERYLSVRLDISARKELELLRHAGESWNSDAAGIARIGGWKFDDIAGFCDISDETRNIFDLDESFVASDETIGELYPEAERARFVAACCTCLQTGEPFAIEIATRTVFDRKVWVLISGRKHSNDGSHGYVLGSVQDITLRKEADALLASVTDQLASFFTISPDPLCIWNFDGTLVKGNPALYRLLGYLDGSLEGPPTRPLVHPDAIQANETAKVALTGEAHTVELVSRLRCQDGSYKSFEWRLRATDAVVYAAGRDISQRLMHEQELVARRTEAEAANLAKSSFLAGMSHELRTPLNAIIGFSEMISGEILGPVGMPAYVEYAAAIHDSGNHLLSIVNNILDLAKIGSGRFTLHEDQIDLPGLVASCLTIVGQAAEKAGVTLEAVLPQDLPSLWADETRVRQTLINLLSNAVKFTPTGGSVQVRAQVRVDGWLAISVSDSGIGMSEEQIGLALQPFRQIDSSHARKYEGTGLGLSLAQGLMELHGGQLVLTSNPGVGTIATFSFPATRIRYRSQGAAA